MTKQYRYTTPQTCDTFELLQAEDVRTYDIFKYIDFVIEQKGDVPLSLFRKFLAEEVNISNEPHNEGLTYKHQFVVTEHISPEPTEEEIEESARKHKERWESMSPEERLKRMSSIKNGKHLEPRVNRFKYSKYERDADWPDWYDHS